MKEFHKTIPGGSVYLHRTTETAITSFADYCRTGKQSTVPVSIKGRDKLYRELVFGVIEDTLTTAYPLASQLLGEVLWNELVQDFFARHQCTTPILWQMPGELTGFVRKRRKDLCRLYPCLNDLLLFEWQETQVFMMKDRKPVKISNGKNSLLFNREVKVIQTAYPVHLKTAAQITEADKSSYYILAYRHPEEKTVEFIDMNPLLLLFLGALAKLKDVNEAINFTSENTGVPAVRLKKAVTNFIKNLNTKLFN